MKIGIVDLDTSHPAAWIPIERSLGHQITGVLDSGSVHPPGYAQRFASEHQIPKVFASLDEMVSQVDCAIVHSCDWDTQVEKARPFVEAGKAVLIDKPLAGNRSDLRQIQSWAERGTRVFGGSSLRFCRETREWLAKPIDERGVPHTVMCGCAVDEFNYGIHAYSMLAGILGTGARSVRHLGDGPQRRVRIQYADGRCGIVAVGATAAWLPFYANVTTERSVAQLLADSSTLYRSMLQIVLPYLAGETEAPMTPQEWLEPELCALAAQRSWQKSDCEAALSELTDADRYDGKAFAESYRKARYANGW
jgi:hypothetical protein